MHGNSNIKFCFYLVTQFELRTIGRTIKADPFVWDILRQIRHKVDYYCHIKISDSLDQSLDRSTAVSALSWRQTVLTVQVCLQGSWCTSVEGCSWTDCVKNCEVTDSRSAWHNEVWSGLQHMMSGRHVEVGARWCRIWRSEKSWGKWWEIKCYLRRWKIICVSDWVSVCVYVCVGTRMRIIVMLCVRVPTHTCAV